jgi:hypothetical protein
VYRNLFEKLDKEEEEHYGSDDEELNNWLPNTTFGEQDTSYEPTLKTFYNTWGNFSTRKSFRWFDKYRLSEVRMMPSTLLSRLTSKGPRSTCETPYGKGQQKKPRGRKEKV